MNIPPSLHPTSPVQTPIRFGGISAPLIFLEKNPLAETVFKDVLGFNVPKIIFTRTPSERLDVATLELSNTAITVGLSLLLPQLVRGLVQRVSAIPKAELVGKAAADISAKARLARLGASFGFMFPFASAFWAAVFFRNYLTVERSNTANFEALIGLEKKGEAQQKRTPEEEKRYQLHMAWKVLGIGTALGLASGLGFSLAARRYGKEALPKSLEWLFSKFHLRGEAGGKIADQKGFFQKLGAVIKGNGANQVNDGLATFLFWLAPAYLGWLHAARGPNEFKEQALKAANGVLWFSIFTPMVVKPIFSRFFKKVTGETASGTSDSILRRLIGKISGNGVVPTYEQILTHPRYAPVRDQLMKLKNKQFGIGLAITVLMLGASPQILNIFLTRRRYEQEQNEKQQPQPDFGSRPVHPSLVIRPDSPFKAFENRQHPLTVNPALQPETPELPYGVPGYPYYGVSPQAYSRYR